MDLYDYQARDLFERNTRCRCSPVSSPTHLEEVKAAAEKLGGVVVVKAQVKTGGRGKAGGVKVAQDPEEAFEAAQSILGLRHQGARS